MVKYGKNEEKLKNEHRQPLISVLECIGGAFLTYRKPKRSACDKRYLFLLESLIEIIMVYSDEKTAHDLIVLFRKAGMEAFELSKIKNGPERKKARIEAEDRLIRECEVLSNKIMFL